MADYPIKRILKSTNLWLLLIFIVYSIFIIIQSKLQPDGFLTSDSTHYLQMAENLLNGNGMTTINLVPEISTYFATWPIGYPALIAIASFVTGVGVFWAAKLVNILLLGLCFVLIKCLFKQRAPIVGMIFFISTFTTVFVYTWSEVPFIFGMIWLVYGIVNYVEANKIRYAFHMMFAALFLFFMRYIGLIGAGIVGLIGFYYLFSKQWRHMLTCWIAGSIPMLIAGIYLFYNYLQTGLLTGMERIPRAETASEFMIMLWQGLVAEFNTLATSSHVYVAESIIILLVGLLLFVRPRHIRALFSLNRRQFLLPGMFLFVGLVYFIAIVYMRWNAHFDPFNFRLLGPATLMLWLFFISWVTQLKQRDWARWRGFLLLVLGIAFVMNVGYNTYTSLLSPSPDYADTVNKVQETYEEIPAGSIIAFENIHARYLRPDLQYIKVHFQPYFAEKESVKALRERISPNHAAGVYLQTGPIREDRYHDSFIKLIKSARDSEDFVKLE
ncbi:ArnT family glycosyltransferase [Lentibacillus sp. Marseille-P4043]|uniref:ArnT family glycosyltransferase n=1 Tax=Lentibacillus sp. Marseille-P4043 TaxID=2040293 RepID=UPI000D0AEBD3|nr:hypothetical protein [Lentibacillus sp. Marseille-P4043]